MTNEFPLCRECQAEGVITFATFIHPAADEDLDGPAMGDPDFWPEPSPGPAALCGSHYARLPADNRLAYVLLPFCAA